MNKILELSRTHFRFSLYEILPHPGYLKVYFSIGFGYRTLASSYSKGIWLRFAFMRNLEPHENMFGFELPLFSSSQYTPDGPPKWPKWAF
jgi:hypothetical protein